MKKVLLFAFLILSSFATLVAMPYAIQGEIRVPDAYVLPNKMIEVSYTSFMSTLTDEGDHEHDFGIMINSGIKDWVELGVFASGSSIYYASAKLRVVKETEVLPAISMGIDNFLSPIKNTEDPQIAAEMTEDELTEYDDVLDKYDYTRNSIYAVITKSTVMRGLPFMPYLDTKMHLGFGTKRFQGMTSLSKQLNGIFMGLELKPINNLGVVFEMDGYNINAGLKLTLKNFTVNTCVYKIEELDRRPIKLAFNIKYTFDMFSKIKFKDSKNKASYKQVMSTGRRVMTSDDFSTSGNPLDTEIENLKAKRLQTEKELEKIRKLLED